MCLVTFLFSTSAFAQDSVCYKSYELSSTCITKRGISEKTRVYEHMIANAQRGFRTSYKIRLRVIGSKAAMDMYPGSEVFIEPVLNQEKQNESFVINVLASFLELQPEILFEHSAYHEVAHIVNGDVGGRRRNGENAEAVAEHSVMNQVGETRYRELLWAFAVYQHLDTLKYNAILTGVRNARVLQFQNEIDDADILAAAYFRKISDGKEHLLVYNGKIHDITYGSTEHSVGHDPQKLAVVISEGRPMIFFHNHPTADNHFMFPSRFDFEAASSLEFIVHRNNPNIGIRFRVMLSGREMTSVEYGLKGSIQKEVWSNAQAFRELQLRFADIYPNGGMAVILEMGLNRLRNKQSQLNHQISIESHTDYLIHACPVDLSIRYPDNCETHPQYFIWPSDKFFLHYRGTIKVGR